MFLMMRINEKQIQRMMKQMGMKTEDIEATEVTIKGKGKNYVIRNPKVTVINVQGEKIIQIMGDIKEEEGEKLPFSEDDIQLVMQQTGCTREEAEKVLKETNGQPAEAIIKILKDHGHP